LYGQARLDASYAALSRARDIAQAAAATALMPRILPWLAVAVCFRGQPNEGLALLHQGRAIAEESGDRQALLWLAMTESGVLQSLGKFEAAAGMALSGLQAARQAGREASVDAIILAFVAASSLLFLGRTAEAAALIDPLTAGPPDRDRWLAHECRVLIDLLRGDIAAAAGRWRANASIAPSGILNWALTGAETPRIWHCGQGGPPTRSGKCGEDWPCSRSRT
jgi:ATP/maltotriose-dependent transcriptional regulator MalT